VKCRRCKTIFDYETTYGICPKCAAYNRPDGRDELKEVLGEQLEEYKEAYQPPVMSNEDPDTFSNHNKHVKASHEKKKSYHDRLCNPYLEKAEGTVKKKTSSKKKSGKAAIALLVFLLGIAAEFAETAIPKIRDWFEDFEVRITDVAREKMDFSEMRGAYSETFEVCGRNIALAMPYQIRPDQGKETLLVIPYHTEITNKILDEVAFRDCYLLYDGVYLAPLERNVVEELLGDCDGVGDLQNTEEEGYKSLVFSVDLQNSEAVMLNLFYQSPDEEAVAIFYYLEEIGEWQLLQE